MKVTEIVEYYQAKIYLDANCEMYYKSFLEFYNN